jgi:Copper transport outer membrane protein, MctB
VFDFRYHVASLAAVFIALILGIVIGVGLSGSGVTKETDLKIAQRDRDKFRAEAESYKEQRDQLRKAGNAFTRVYPAVMNERLRGKRVAVLFVGPVDGGISNAIETALTDAGAHPATRTVALNVPIDVEPLDNALVAQGPKLQRYVGDSKLDALGGALADEFVNGGETPLWKVLGRVVVGERTGNGRQPADAVVVVRTTKPQVGPTARFLHGLYTGLASSDIPAVGVEDTGTTPSAVATFHDRGLASVDDIDLDTGRAALALLLAGATPGRYGVRDDADAILPAAGG